MRAMRFAVIGDPVSHSKSPVMHTAAFRALGLPHTYEALHVSEDELFAAVERLRAGEFDGLNVTVPHKQRILNFVNEVDESAALVGASNTLVRGLDGRVTAYNTDAAALASELRALGATAHQEASALVLGAGGAARSAIVALSVFLGYARVVVRARAFSDSELADAFRLDVTRRLASAGAETTISTETLEPKREPFAVVVQCTSAGMIGKDSGRSVAGAIAWDYLSPGAVALDVIYAPPETDFLRAAAGVAVSGANGLGMLVEQGAVAFQLWLGVDPPRPVMRVAIM